MVALLLWCFQAGSLYVTVFRGWLGFGGGGCGVGFCGLGVVGLLHKVKTTFTT